MFDTEDPGDGQLKLAVSKQEYMIQQQQSLSPKFLGSNYESSID